VDRQPFKRTDRVADQIRQIISAAIVEKAHHYGLENVTITAADVSPDLRHSKVYYRVLDVARLQATQKAMASARSFLRQALAKSLKTRVSPRIEFVYDESIDQGQRIEGLLQKIRSDVKPSEEE